MFICFIFVVEMTEQLFTVGRTVLPRSLLLATLLDFLNHTVFYTNAMRNPSGFEVCFVPCACGAVCCVAQPR